MDKSFRALQLRQLDVKLAPWLSACPGPRPGGGWINAIREALGMSAVALARRMAVRNTTVHKLEASELSESITLASLRKAAAALDCELHYAFVPRRPLAEMLRDRARELAKAELAPVAHTMALEGQAVSAEGLELLLAARTEELLSGSRRALW